MDQREWDYGARLPRERSASDPWSPSQRPESPDSSGAAEPGAPVWGTGSVTDTGSMQPIPEAVAWSLRAEAWAQNEDQAVERSSSGTVSRWSEVAATGRPAVPAEGFGWRTSTSEWRATSETGRWRQTTEWRSASGTSGWRTTTEAWQAGQDAESFPPVPPPGPAATDPPNRLPAISGTAWPTPETDAAPSWRAGDDIPSWRSGDDTPSWRQSGSATGPSGPDATPSWRQDATPSWQREASETTPSWQSAADSSGRPAPADATPSWQRAADPTPSWQSPADPISARPGDAPGWSRGEETPSWRRTPDPTPSWQSPAPASGLPQSSRSERPSWDARPSWQSADAPQQPSWADDGRHYVREDDRAQWRRESAAGQAGLDAGSRSAGRRRAPEPGSRTTGGTGWSTRSDADNWAGHTDTGSIPAYQDPLSDTGSWRRDSTDPADRWRTSPESTDRRDDPADRRRRADEPSDSWRMSTTTDSWQSSPSESRASESWQRPASESPASESWRSADESRGGQRRADRWRGSDPAGSAEGWRGGDPPAPSGPADGWRSGDQSRDSGWGDNGPWRRDPDPAPPVDPWAQSATETGVIPLPLQPRTPSDTGSWDRDQDGRRSRSDRDDTGSWRDGAPSDTGSWRRDQAGPGPVSDTGSWRRDQPRPDAVADTGSWSRDQDPSSTGSWRRDQDRSDPNSWRRDQDRPDTGSWRRDQDPSDPASRRRGQDDADSGSWRRRELESGAPQSPSDTGSWRGPGAPLSPADTGSWRGRQPGDSNGWRGRELESGTPQGPADTGSRRRRELEGPADGGRRRRELESGAPQSPADTGSWRGPATPQSPSDTGSWRSDTTSRSWQERSDAGSWQDRPDPASWQRGDDDRQPDGRPGRQRGPEPQRDPRRGPEPQRDPRRGPEPQRDPRRGPETQREPRRGLDAQRGAGMPPRRDSRDYARRREPDTSWQRELETAAWDRDHESDVWLRDADTGQWHRATAEDDEDDEDDRGDSRPRRRRRAQGPPPNGPLALESGRPTTPDDWRDRSPRGAEASRADDPRADNWRDQDARGADRDGDLRVGRRRAPDTRPFELEAGPSARRDATMPDGPAEDPWEQAPPAPGSRPDAARPVSGLPNRPVSGMPDRPVSGLPDRPISGMPDAPTSGVPGRPVSSTPATRPVSSTPATRPVSSAPAARRLDEPTARRQDDAATRRPESPAARRQENPRQDGPADWRTDTQSGSWRPGAQAEAQAESWRNQLRAEQGEPPLTRTPDAVTEIIQRTDEPAPWLQAEREQARGRGGEDGGSGSAGYREGNTTDWRRELKAESNLAEGESRRFGTSDFVPFRAPSQEPVAAAAARVPEPVSAPAAGGAAAATGLMPRTGPSWQDPPDTEWPPRGAVMTSPTGAYERRPVSTLTSASARQNDLLEPEEELEEDTGGPLAAVGYTVVWYGVPVVLFVAYMLIVNGAQQGQAVDTLIKAAPQFALSLVLSMLVAVGLRWASGSWKAASVGLASAVVGGGLATVLTSAITGNSLS
ncbi:hypothetical protein [Symbioplanes lichenis]|uniref:hypothetical protein n=1 Tax=Symbioplanes lichenis TaxID=1629072 RepID=UPI00273A08DE|nr:hypothetical protein [Actinoplanes lichenis]